MYKPIIQNEEINFSNLYQFLIRVLSRYIKIILFFVTIYVVYFFLIKDVKYSASVSFYTDYNSIENSSSLSVLQNLTDPQRQDLSFSVSNYLNSDKFLESMVLHQYSVDGKNKTLIEIWGITGNRSFNPLSIIRSFSLIPSLSLNDKKLLIAKKRLGEKIGFVEDRKTGLNTISVITKISPDITKQISKKMLDSILAYSNEVTSVKASEKVSFVKGRLDDIKFKLESSEDEMLRFLQNNKNRTSPHLTLTKNRIQRNINLYNQIFISLSDQLEIAKIDKQDNTSSIVILDSAHSSPYKSGRTLFENIFILAFGLYAIFLIIDLYNNRKILFR